MCIINYAVKLIIIIKLRSSGVFSKVTVSNFPTFPNRLEQNRVEPNKTAT